MDASQCAEMLALVAQSIEASRSLVVYQKQAATFATRLLIFQTACNHCFHQGGEGSAAVSRVEVAVTELTAITCAQDAIEKLLHSYIEQCESTFSTDLWDWPDWEQFFDKRHIFTAATREMLTFAGLLRLTLPLGLMNDCVWQDEVDMHVDWSSALRACEGADSLSLVGFLKDHPPPRPALRRAAPADILTLFEVDTAYGDSSDEDENEEVDDDYASENEDEYEKEQRKATEEEARRVRAMKYRGNFTSSVFVSTLKGAPVMLKKMGASYCRGGDGHEGVGHGLLGLAVTAQHLRLAESPHLLRPLAVCTEGVGVTEQDGQNQLESLQARRQKEKDEAAGKEYTPPTSSSHHGFSFGGAFGHHGDDTTWKDHPVPRTLGLVYPLAPYGCLMTFLQQPPPGLVPKGGGKDRSVAVPSRVKLSIMLDVCQGLEHLHAHGVVHGRLHSRNVLICGDFRAKLVDFGVSHLVSAACATGNGLSGAKKGEGFNPRWRAPEDLLRAEYSHAFPDDDAEERGEHKEGGLVSLLHHETEAHKMLVEQHSYALVTRQSDVYAFGMVMYSIAVDGNRPFYNLPWDEAVINTVKAGGRPSFPTWIDSKKDLNGLIREEGDEEGEDAINRPLCLIEECWADDPDKRVLLSYARDKLETNLGNVLKQYGNVVIDNMEARVAALTDKVATLSATADAADVKIEHGRATLQKMEASMEKMFKPVDKKGVQQQLDSAYPNLKKAVDKNEALRAEIAALTAQRDELLGEKGAHEQDLYVRKTLLEKRNLSSVEFTKEAFVKQFTEYTKPFVLKHLRSACVGTDSLLLSPDVAEEFLRHGEEGVPRVPEDMWAVVCRGAVFGAASSYRPKISSMFGYGWKVVGGGGAGGGDTSADANKASAKTKLVVDVNKYCDSHDFEKEVHLEVDRRGLLAKSRSFSRKNVYFNTHSQVSLIEDNFADPRESQFLTEGFSPLNRYKDVDKKRKKLRCAAQFLNTYDFVEHDNTERMFVQPEDLTRELQFLLAARGDVRDANGMLLKNLGYNQTFLLQLATGTGADISGGSTSLSPAAESSARSSPCHLAASLGHLYALKFLIDVHGIASDAADCDTRGWSPLSLACYQGHLPVLRYLSERHRADMERVDCDGLAPIHLAAMRGHLSLLRYLLFRLRHKGDAFYFTDKELGGGLLHWACMTTSNSVPLRSFDIVVARHVDTVLFLLAEEDMDVNMASTVDQSTPLMWLCGAAPHSMTKYRLVDTLIENGADLSLENSLGQSCLHYAAASGDFLLLQTLVEEFNMDVFREDRRGVTAEQVAGTAKCAAYLEQCRKAPPPKNLDFVPQRFLKKRSAGGGKGKGIGSSSGKGGEGGGDAHPPLQEPRAIGTYLLKKSPSLMVGWQKRYFVMKEGYLRYYSNKEDYEGNKAPKGSIDLLQLPSDDPDKAAFLAGAELNEIHLHIKGTEPDKKDKKTKATKDRMFVLQAPDHETAASWLAIVKEWVLFLH